MKQVKTFALTGLITIGAFAMIAYSSCSKKETDKCEAVICKNNGNCVDGSCKCPAGYEGADCGQTSALKFTGFWAAADACSIPQDSSFNYHITISTSNADPLQVDVKGIAGTDFTFSATANGKTLTISEQTATDGRTYSATITYSNASTLTMSYNIKNASGNYIQACTSTLTKS
jgi:hypothetical protein